MKNERDTFTGFRENLQWPQTYSVFYDNRVHMFRRVRTVLPVPEAARYHLDDQIMSTLKYLNLKKIFSNILNTCLQENIFIISFFLLNSKLKCILIRTRPIWRQNTQFIQQYILLLPVCIYYFWVDTYEMFGVFLSQLCFLRILK